MQHDWIIDVLSDLRIFADNHNLGRLAEQLDDTILMAAAEIKGVEGAGIVAGSDEPTNNHLFGRASTG
jgi:hypothetical protein